MSEEKNEIETAVVQAERVYPEPEDVGAPPFDPADYEVRALGHNDHHFFYYSTQRSMVIALSARNHKHLELIGMANEIYWQHLAGFGNAGQPPDKIPWTKAKTEPSFSKAPRRPKPLPARPSPMRRPSIS